MIAEERVRGGPRLSGGAAPQERRYLRSGRGVLVGVAAGGRGVGVRVGVGVQVGVGVTVGVFLGVVVCVGVLVTGPGVGVGGEVLALAPLPDVPNMIGPVESGAPAGMWKSR